MKITTPHIALPLACLLLVACGEPKPASQADQSAAMPDNPHDLSALIQALPDDDTPEAKPIITADGKIQIDWSLIDTKTPKADLTNYTYPIALDSQAVQNYAKAYHISDKQAQHSIVVSMASPEALGKLLDQLEGSYVSHELTDGKDMTLIVHTKSDVLADKHDYVFADKFGEGLVLPIEIRPQSQ